MMAKIIMHFVVTTDKAPANHMISGEPVGAIPFANAVREKIGHQGQAYRLACDPKLQTGEVHRATGEPWALLELVEDGAGGHIAAIGETTCQACLKTKEWQEAYAKTPHPMANKVEQQMQSGGCC